MSEEPAPADARISTIISAAENLRDGKFSVRVSVEGDDEIGRLGRALHDLARTLEQHRREVTMLNRITTRINHGLLLDDILNQVYEDFRSFIPYNRIGFALIDDDCTCVRARWARTDLAEVHLQRGFTAPLAGSSLEMIINTGQPRILNDLEEYLAGKPDSYSTRLIVAEGLRSSLTCPLIANGVPVGFMFFSSTRPYTYAQVHIELFQQIAEQLSVTVEKGRLVSQLADQKDQLLAQNEELRRLNEQKNAFLGMAAHDLRNPIGLIQMMAAYLRSAPVDTATLQRERFLGDIYRVTEQLLAMLNDLLDVTQIDHGIFSVQPERVNLGMMLTETLERHQMLASPKGTRISLDCPEGGAVMADPKRLRQVLDNLISNAVKFSPPGSQVNLSVRAEGDFWRIAVSDHGPGLTAEDRARLFQHFARLSAQPTGGEKSTGLGLAIVRQVVLAHGGQIDVESTPGLGATFWFTLPAA